MRHPVPRGLAGLAALALLLTARPTRAAASPDVGSPTPGEPITLVSLLREMTNRTALARLPSPAYQCLQASSYNRESVHRDQPGWFADSDGLGFIRTVTVRGRTEWLVMEHDGPGCLTRIWTPFFYYALENHTGPNVSVYLDGSDEPVLDESLIQLLLGRGSVPPPFANLTARAGDLYLPIPFARSCRVTLSDKPFYHLVNYRAYAPGTTVESFGRAAFAASAATRDAVARVLLEASTPTTDAAPHTLAPTSLGPSRLTNLDLPRGPAAIRSFTLQLPAAAAQPSVLRTTALAIEFDGEPTVWCPVGDFFGSADSIHPGRTWERTTTSNGTFTCRWLMPYRQAARIRIQNLGTNVVELGLAATSAPWTWDDRSLHFHARWRPDDVVSGTPFQDWNFVDIRGQGLYVGDTWTVLNPQRDTWWGEGDEKIYVDDAWDRGFPTHFGTGSEDYYGWAGGVLPTRADEFSQPFLANLRVGGLDGHTQGYNICSRTRSLDAIPFTRRLRFDMESSFGTDIRNRWNLLAYSVVTFWYARPGATHNHPPDPVAAAQGVLGVEELLRRSRLIRETRPSP